MTVFLKPNRGKGGIATICRLHKAYHSTPEPDWHVTPIGTIGRESLEVLVRADPFDHRNRPTEVGIALG